MNCSGSRLPGNNRSRLVAWYLLALISLVLSVLLFRVLPYVPDAHPTHASEVIPAVPAIAAGDIQRLEGTLTSPPASVRFVLIMGAQFGLWGLMLLTAGRLPQTVSLRAGLITGTVLLLAQLGSRAMLSSDVYAYITQGRTLALYHVNPSSQQSVLAQNDPYLVPLGSYLPSQYGPLWSLISGALAIFGGEHVGLTVLLFRLTAVLGTLLTAGVLWLLAKEVCPQRAGMALVFFLCNPLVIFEMGCGGHNDCWMAAPMLAGVMWAVRGKVLWSVFFFAAAALVKAPSMMVGAFCVLALLKTRPGWHERIRQSALAALLCVVLAGVAFGSANT